MAFGDILRNKIFLLKNASKNKFSNDAFWIILRDIAVLDIINIYPNKVDSDIAIEIYYQILSENKHYLPQYFIEKLKCNGQERYRVINRNLWSSNAFHIDGLANQPRIKAFKTINIERKGERIVYQGDLL